MRKRVHCYGDDPSQYGELYGEGPVAVLIHGGFWKAQYGLDLEVALAQDLAGRGWAAWNIEYRRLGNGGGVPETLDDVAAAIDALADIDGVDLSRVVAIGHSAGGHLAAWSATRENPRVPLTGVVSQAGVLDLQRASRMGSSTVSSMASRPASPRRSNGCPYEFRGSSSTAGSTTMSRLRFRSVSPQRPVRSWRSSPRRVTTSTSTQPTRCGRRSSNGSDPRGR